MTPILPFRRPLEEQARESNFIDEALYLHKLREEAHREAERARRWRKVKHWSKRIGLSVAFVCGVALAVKWIIG